MSGWLILIFIAVALFVGFIIFDKRKFLLEKLKNILKIKPKVKKETEEKIKKEKISKKNKKQDIPKEEKQDYDTMVDQGNLTIGKNFEPEIDTKNENFVDDLQQDDIDLDKLLDELEKADRDSVQKYKDDRFNKESEAFKNAESLSLDEMNDLLENSFANDTSSRNQLGKYGINTNLSGKELGDAIKNLPPQIKAIIISDILKPKFWYCSKKI